ncbi:MAG: hypothetical protein JWO31_4176, partial [Phycisphaerales bacterium]|nr:hypothetical protein [Phycisphaerales bacterium]
MTDVATVSLSLDDAVKHALVGTSRGDLPVPPAAGPLGEALAAVAGAAAGPEARLLAAAAVLSAYEACGRVPMKDGDGRAAGDTAAAVVAAASARPAPASPDVAPACSPRAADFLSQLLAMTDTPAKRQLLGEWFDAAAAARRRVPHAALPDVLEYAAGHRAARPQASAVAGERGHWLMAQNPRWQFGVAAEADPKEVWATGKPDQRLAALRRVRAADPPAALALVESTWKEDGADERAAFVAALADGLGPADEPFLEAALDDRSKQVRAAAVELLAKLPGSAFVARMVAR